MTYGEIKKELKKAGIKNKDEIEYISIKYNTELNIHQNSKDKTWTIYNILKVV